MRIFKLNLLLTVFLVSCQNKTPIIVDNGLLIENVTILSPKNDNYNAIIGDIIIDNDKIISISESSKTIKGNFETIDGTGKYIIPGLIDSHVHLASIAGMNYRHNQKYPEFSKSYFKQLPKSYLYFGYTTLIDVNNYNSRIVNNLLKKSIIHIVYLAILR